MRRAHVHSSNDESNHVKDGCQAELCAVSLGISLYEFCRARVDFHQVIPRVGYAAAHSSTKTTQATRVEALHEYSARKHGKLHPGGFGPLAK